MRPDNDDLRYLLYIVILDPSAEGHAIEPPVQVSGARALTASRVESLAPEWKSPLLCRVLYTKEHQLTPGGASPETSLPS